MLPMMRLLSLSVSVEGRPPSRHSQRHGLLLFRRPPIRRICSNWIELFSTEEGKTTAQTGNAVVYVKSASDLTGSGNVFLETTSHALW